MRAIKATIQDGVVTLEEPVSVRGRAEAIVIVLDQDPWDALASDARPRPALTDVSREALEEFLGGQTTPLDPETMD